MDRKHWIVVGAAALLVGGLLGYVTLRAVYVLGPAEFVGVHVVDVDGDGSEDVVAARDVSELTSSKRPAVAFDPDSGETYWSRRAPIPPFQRLTHRRRHVQRHGDRLVTAFHPQSWRHLGAPVHGFTVAALEGSTGRVEWSHQLPGEKDDDFKLGSLGSNAVLVRQAAPGAEPAVVAYDLSSGDKQWSGPPSDTGTLHPRHTNFAGGSLFVRHDDSTYAASASGEWRRANGSNEMIAVGDRVFLVVGDEHRVVSWSPGEGAPTPVRGKGGEPLVLEQASHPTLMDVHDRRLFVRESLNAEESPEDMEWATEIRALSLDGADAQGFTVTIPGRVPLMDWKALRRESLDQRHALLALGDSMGPLRLVMLDLQSGEVVWESSRTEMGMRPAQEDSRLSLREQLAQFYKNGCNLPRGTDLGVVRTGKFAALALPLPDTSSLVVFDLESGSAVDCLQVRKSGCNVRIPMHSSLTTPSELYGFEGRSIWRLELESAELETVRGPTVEAKRNCPAVEQFLGALPE